MKVELSAISKSGAHLKHSINDRERLWLVFSMIEILIKKQEEIHF